VLIYYQALTQLVVLANLEGINAELIRQKISQSERLIKLNEIAISQMKALANNPSVKKLGEHFDSEAKKLLEIKKKK